MQKWGERIFSNRQLGMRVYINIVMIMVWKYSPLPYRKIKSLRARFPPPPHPRNIHKYNWTAPDGKNHNQIDNILIDRRRHSSILDVGSFRGADCETDHYLVVAKLRERLAVRKQATQNSEGEIFNLRKLNELGVNEKYLIEITNRFATLENLNGDENVNRTWENIKGNIQTSAKESLSLHEWKQHKPWFDKECVEFLDQRKQAKMQWIQDPSRSNVYNPNNVRRNASRHFMKKEGISES